MQQDQAQRLREHMAAFDADGQRIAACFVERLREAAPGGDAEAISDSVRRARLLPDAIRLAVGEAEQTAVIHRALFDPDAGGTAPEASGPNATDLTRELEAAVRSAAGEQWDPALEGEWRGVVRVVTRFVLGVR